MKNFIFWLAKIFDVDITVEKIVYRDRYVTVEKEKQVSLGGVIDGDLTVKGNLTVKGSLTATKGISCYKKIGD